jgi:hypothetical protein
MSTFALPIRRGRKKALWMQAFPEQKKPSAKEKLKAEYVRLRTEFLASRTRCECCRKPAKLEIHHRRGRLRTLLIATKFWSAVCASCHRWITDHPTKARRLGLLCRLGDWNRLR